MKWLRNYRLFKEAVQMQAQAQNDLPAKPSYSSKNLISEICVSMLLLNNSFLDNLLDRGLKARYSENSDIFLTDLKNLVIAKNRLSLGRFEGERCVEDSDLGKINSIFDGADFSIEADWDKLANARTTARNIIDKLLPDEKLDSQEIERIYWIGPNKTKEYGEDIVIELRGGKQYSLYLNKSLSTQKSASFNTFADDLIGPDMERLYGEEYISRWDKLAQQWVKILYENANKNVQKQVEKFIDPKRIETLGYFEYFDIRHQDPKFRHLGEFMEEFDKNILKFSDLMSEIWKNRESCFMDVARIEKEWYETKVVILNSKILENLLTSSLKTKFPEDVEKQEGERMKKSGGTVKMKLFKTLVEKMGCLERPVYFLGSNGNSFNLMPSREFFRQKYDEMDLKFDYHVSFDVSEEEEGNDFKIEISLELGGEKLIGMQIIVKFSGGEMSGKLGAKYRYELADNFSYLVAKESSAEEKENNEDEASEEVR
jgi:hypothetical protein